MSIIGMKHPIWEIYNALEIQAKNRCTSCGIVKTKSLASILASMP